MNAAPALPQAEPLQRALQQSYPHGFVTDVDTDALPPGLDEDTVRAISRRKREPDFLLKWRLAALQRWQSMAPPDWGQLHIAPIDFQALSYYSAPKSLQDGPKSLADVDPKLLETYESWACRCTNARAWPAWRSTRCSTRSRWAPPSASSWPRSG
jgi:Fe-S cluster assembly protein SufB